MKLTKAEMRSMLGYKAFGELVQSAIDYIQDQVWADGPVENDEAFEAVMQDRKDGSASKWLVEAWDHSGIWERVAEKNGQYRLNRDQLITDGRLALESWIDYVANKKQYTKAG